MFRLIYDWRTKMCLKYNDEKESEEETFNEQNV